MISSVGGQSALCILTLLDKPSESQEVYSTLEPPVWREVMNGDQDVRLTHCSSCCAIKTSADISRPSVVPEAEQDVD